MVPCLAVLKSIYMSHCPREDVIQTLLTLLSGPETPPLQQSAMSPLLSLTHMGNYMQVGRKVKIGSDHRALSVFYGIASLPFSEGKPARLIPGSRIIGTAQGQGVVIIGGYRQVRVRPATHCETVSIFSHFETGVVSGGIRGLLASWKPLPSLSLAACPAAESPSPAAYFSAPTAQRGIVFAPSALMTPSRTGKTPCVVGR